MTIKKKKRTEEVLCWGARKRERGGKEVRRKPGGKRDLTSRNSSRPLSEVSSWERGGRAAVGELYTFPSGYVNNVSLAFYLGLKLQNEKWEKPKDDLRGSDSKKDKGKVWSR